MQSVTIVKVSESSKSNHDKLNSTRKGELFAHQKVFTQKVFLDSRNGRNVPNQAESFHLTLFYPKAATRVRKPGMVELREQINLSAETPSVFEVLAQEGLSTGLKGAFQYLSNVSGNHGF